MTQLDNILSEVQYKAIKISRKQHIPFCPNLLTLGQTTLDGDIFLSEIVYNSSHPTLH